MGIWSIANSTCNATRAGGYVNWRLPTKSELSALYSASKSELSAAGWTLYGTWSSNDGGAPLHYSVNLSNGYVGNDPDNYNRYVSCVR
jgi:hypothetical protein